MPGPNPTHSATSEPRRSSVAGETPGPGLTTPPELDQQRVAHNADDTPGTIVQVGMPTLLGNPDWPTVAGHEITGEIAKGGMGIVFAAHDISLKREVAIKTLLPELAGHSHLAHQFDRESRITAQLPHPGVPPVHAIGTLPDGRPFLVMKLIRGRTLDAELRATDRVVTLPRLLSVFEQICQTVGYAHSVGIIHRDLKPLNVMVGAFGEVQVMDWGIARWGVGIETSGISEAEDSSAATAMIGMIALAGIADRNAILLIDFIQHVRDRGATLKEALIESGAVRFRPILLTAGAAMLGAWPITLDPVFSGLAWALIFGLLVSTAFTLLLVPVVYWMLYRGLEGSPER